MQAAVDAGLELIPCLNKIDLPGAEPERVLLALLDAGDDPAAVDSLSSKAAEAEVQREAGVICPQHDLVLPGLAHAVIARSPLDLAPDDADVLAQQ